MLSIKQVFCLLLLHYFVCGIQNQPSQFSNVNWSQKLPDSYSSAIPCGPEKSLHSRKDIKVMIDHIFNIKSLNKTINDNYKLKAEAIRDKHLQNLNYFLNWSKNKPLHLKHVLQSLSDVRKLNVEPAVEKVAALLEQYPHLEMLYKEKNDKTNELQNKLLKYENICQSNCENKQIKVHNITKRSVQNDYYCSSLLDLHNEITQKLLQLVQQLNNNTSTKLSLNDALYGLKIDKIKSNFKDKALQKIGRTMYDILDLQDAYQHFMDDLTSNDLEVSIYTIKSLGLHIDKKLLNLENAVDKYGRHCNSCGSKRSVRNVKLENTQLERKVEAESPNIVSELIEIKSDEIKSDIDRDWKSMFNDLEDLIRKSEAEQIDLENLKPIQEEVKAVVIAEKEVLDKLKNRASNEIIKKLLELIKKLQTLLEIIKKILEKLGK